MFLSSRGRAGDGCGVYRRRAGAETLIRKSCRDGYSSGKPFQPLSRQNPTCCGPRRRAAPKAKSNARAKTLADATVESHPNVAKCATLGWGTHRPKKQSAKNKNHLSFPAPVKRLVERVLTVWLKACPSLVLKKATRTRYCAVRSIQNIYPSRLLIS